MCKTKMAVDVSHPTSPPTRSSDSRRTRSSSSHRPPNFTASSSSTSSSAAYVPSSSASGSYYTTASSSTSSRTSLTSLRSSISQNPNIYDISEIRAATNNFLAKRYSSSSTACWRCTLRSIDALVFQRKFRRKMEMSRLKERLAIICRSNHTSVIRLLGVSISGDHIYLVYEFVAGGNLAVCLRNKRNSNFTVLSSWDSRMQIAADLSDALDYVHNKTGLNLTLVHNHIKSSSIIITEPDFNAKICHFGTAQLCGEAPEDESLKFKEISEIEEEEEEESKLRTRSKELKRSNSGNMQFEGVRGYMSPEFQASGIPTQKSDVYAFGVVILELLSGEEPFKYKHDKSSGDFVRTSLTETARAVMDGGADGREGRVRRWMDRRMKDSFPVEVAEKLVRLALECVHVEADKRPDMSRVAGKISKLYLASKAWSEKMRISDQISVSLAPR